MPSLSVLDGWWIEGCIDDVTGWAIGDHSGASVNPSDGDNPDAASLYGKLEISFCRAFTGIAMNL